ncbi:WD40 repeat-like protein [Suillus weaverae]|nr:WD40 repeat-like protein [Suillus weaverae]
MVSEVSESSASVERREAQREALSNSPAPVVLLRTSAKDPPPYGAQHRQDALWEEAGGNEALPPRWQRYKASNGETRYQDNTLMMVSWNRPLPGVRLDSPGDLVVAECEWHISPHGRSYFVNHNTRTTSWKKPAPERPAGSLMPECVIGGHSKCIWSLVYLGASCNVISASGDGSIRQWKRDGEPVGKPLESDRGGISSMAICPNETMVVCGSGDGRLRLWNIKKGSIISEPWEGHDDAVRCLDWSPNALEIASGSEDGTLRRWSPDTGQQIAPPIKTSHVWVYAVKYSPHGDKFASGGVGAICIWSKDGKLLIEIKGHEDWVTSLCWSKDGAHIFSGSGDYTIRKWRAIDGQELVVFQGHTLLIRSLCLTPNGSHLVSASFDCSIRIWDLKTNQPVGDPLLHDDEVFAVAISPDGKYIASAGSDKKIYVWRLEAALKVVGADDGNAKLKASLLCFSFTLQLTSLLGTSSPTESCSARYTKMQGNDFFGSESDRAAPPASPSSLTHRRRLLSSIHFGTRPANSSTDQQHIKYYDSKQGPPANNADQESSVTPTPPPGQVAPGSSLPNGIGAMFPTGALQDADDIRWTMSQPGTRLGTRTANGAHAQSSPNTKGKAPTRLRRDDRNVFGTDDGHRTATGATADSITTSRDHTTSLEQTRALSHSPQDLTNELQGRSRYPITSGGFGDIWKCELVKPDGAVQVAVKTIRAFESDNEVLMRKNNRVMCSSMASPQQINCPWGLDRGVCGHIQKVLITDVQILQSNVLISGNGRACLADFGLSTIILEFIGTSYFTSSIRGHVRWVAAELCEVSEDGELSLSTECDIYSFGSITLQVLTCKVPYYNVKKDIAVLGQVIKGMKLEPPPESQIAPGHWEFIQRCWSPRASRPSIAEVECVYLNGWATVFTNGGKYKENRVKLAWLEDELGVPGQQEVAIGRETLRHRDCGRLCLVVASNLGMSWLTATMDCAKGTRGRRGQEARLINLSTSVQLHIIIVLEGTWNYSISTSLSNRARCSSIRVMFSEARRREAQREALSNSPAPVVLPRTSPKDPPPYGAQHRQDALWEEAGGNEALPPEWQRFKASNGETIYQDDTLIMVSRNRPLPGVRLDYPGYLVVAECEWHISPLGRSYFVNHNTRTTSWKKPAPERPAGSLMPECVIEGHSECIWSLVYLGARCNVMSASGDGSIRQWKRDGESVGKPLESDGGVIGTMAVSPNETMVVCGGVDSKLRLWNIKKGSMIGDPWEGHDAAVRCLDWSPNALEIASGSQDGTIRRWNPDIGRQIAPPIKTSHIWVLAVKYSPQGDKFASGGAGAICIWSKDGKLLIEIKGHEREVTSLCWSKDGAYIFSGSGDHTIRKWRAIDGQELVVFRGHTLLVSSLCLSLNESYIVSGSNDCSIRIWDLKTNQPVGDPLLHDDEVLTVAMSPDGKYIASAGKDKKIYVWSLEAALKVVGADDGNAKLKASRLCFSFTLQLTSLLGTSSPTKNRAPTHHH